MYFCDDYPMIGCLSINHNVLLLYDACSGASASLLVRDYISPYCEQDAQVLPWASGWGWGGPSRLSPVSMKVAISLWQHTKISSLMTSKLGKGNCAFPAGLHGWAFAKMNESKFGVDEAKMERLWGGNYFDTGSATCKRGFFSVLLWAYEPIKRIIKHLHE